DNFFLHGMKKLYVYYERFSKNVKISKNLVRA
ncbi:hypothetical protein Q179_02814, partial [Staphylococcus aureus M1177]